jgi:hypothetical protein
MNSAVILAWALFLIVLATVIAGKHIEKKETPKKKA